MSELEGKPNQINKGAGSGKRPASRFQMENCELVGSVKKNFLETVKINVYEYQSTVYVDARIFVSDAMRPGGVIATRKGLRLTTDLLSKLLPLLSKAQEMATLRGLDEGHEEK